MAKFLKSIFHTSDRKKSQYEHESEEERSESPQPGTRRQLSISRSGRMKQANKKRHSLALELYGEGIQIDAVEKPRTVEYHVHSPSQIALATLGRTDPTRTEGTSSTEDIPEKSTEMVNAFDVALEKKLSKIAIDKSPEEEIDNAFEVLDKS